MREHYPTVYEGVRQAILDGCIEPQGGFFAECDTNLPCGESMIRQTLYGKRAWREICGMDVRMCWLPDTFGYSGNLPQILKSAVWIAFRPSNFRGTESTCSRTARSTGKA